MHLFKVEVSVGVLDGRYGYAEGICSKPEPFLMCGRIIAIGKVDCVPSGCYVKFHLFPNTLAFSDTVIAAAMLLIAFKW